MSIHPLATPLSVPARPDATGGRRVGVLLSHGFTGSPASMRGWGEALAERGYAVEVPRLPGHGTTWQELNTKRWEDWYAEITRTFQKLEAENDLVVVGGLSMGGGLVLRLAADLGDRVAGVVLVNPAVATKRKDVLALPVLKWVLGSMPGIVNDIKKPGVDEHGYHRTPLKAAHSMMQGWKQVREVLPQVTSPILFLKSATDHVVDPSSLATIRAGVSSREFVELSLGESFHVATIDNDAETIVAESAAFIERVIADVDAGGGPRR